MQFPCAVMFYRESAVFIWLAHYHNWYAVWRQIKLMRKASIGLDVSLTGMRCLGEVLFSIAFARQSHGEH